MTQIGKYDIIQEIGRGGFGNVYEARDLSLERLVALKVLHPQLTVDANFLERFRKEAKALARINHPNVVSIFEIGETEGQIYIAMEYLSQGSLADQLSKGPLPVAHALKIFEEIGSGLDAGHEEGLIHRDVKPANILFNKHGEAVIVDFGLAKAMQVSSTTIAASNGGAVGTPYYRAPELWNGSPPASPATDIYSLACVMYEILTGEVLYDGDTPSVVMAKHANPPEFNERFSECLSTVLRKALNIDATQRYQTVVDFYDDFSKTLRIEEVSSIQNCLNDELQFSMVKIPAGDFFFGTNLERKFIDTYYVSRYPVTNKQYLHYIKANPKCKLPKYWSEFTRTYPTGLDNHPVMVDIENAFRFSEWVNCRLPSEEEWEKAARGTDSREYPWGNDWVDGKYCNSKEARSEKTTPVDHYVKGVSPYGIYDLCGNVYEWTWDYSKNMNWQFFLVGFFGCYVKGGNWKSEKGAVKISVDWFKGELESDYAGIRLVKC